MTSHGILVYCAPTEIRDRSKCFTSRRIRVLQYVTTQGSTCLTPVLAGGPRAAPAPLRRTIAFLVSRKLKSTCIDSHDYRGIADESASEPRNKDYCPDFALVRHVLRDHGATFVEAKEQGDYYYHLPALAEDKGTRRLKLRVEGEKRELIYYQDSQEADTRVSQFQLWSIHDPLVIEVLDVALGNRVIERKQRELWHKNNIRFNLDTVEDVGQILEVEAQSEDGPDIGAQVEECRRFLGP